MLSKSTGILAMATEGRTIAPRAELRMVLGFFALPPAAGLLMFLTCVGLWKGNVWLFEGTGSFDAAVSLGLGIAILALPATFFGAVPAVLWLIRRRQPTLPRLVLLGALVGNLPFAVIFVATLVTQFFQGTLSTDLIQLWFGWRITIRAIVLGLWFGSILAALFWVVAVRGSVLNIADRYQSQPEDVAQ